MIFNDLKYRTGCIKRIDNFDIKSIKFTILKNYYSSFYRLEIQMTLCGNYCKKLYFQQTVYKRDLYSDLYIFKKKLSKRGAIKFIQNCFLEFEPNLVNYWYLPEDDSYYNKMISLEVIL